MVEPCVISYFPGSGGNRLARALLGYPWAKRPGQHMHGFSATPEINLSDRDTRPYPTAQTHIIQRSSLVELTHCMNRDLVARLFPNRRIIKIKTPLIPSLARHWQVWNREFFEEQARTQGVSSAANRHIEWHWTYYSQTGVDWQGDEIWDIDQDSTEFAEYMRTELAACQPPEWHQALHVYQTLKKRSLNFA